MSARSSAQIDCRGMQCPAPILQVSKAAREHKGSPVLLTVTADDEDFPVDVKAWCRSANAQLYGIEEAGGTWTATIGLNGAPAPGDAQAGPRLAAPSLPPEVTPPPTARRPAPQPARQVQLVRPLDAPGPVDLRGKASGAAILELGQALLANGGSIGFLADPGRFQSDVYAWAAATGARVEGLRVDSDGVHGRVELDPAIAAEVTPVVPMAPLPQTHLAATPDAATRENLCTLLVLHNDFENLLAALMVANTSAAQGMEVAIYFSFWGVNLLRGEGARAVEGTELDRPSMTQAMMKWMMPRGPARQRLGKMNMGGIGLGMMKRIMRQKNVLGLEQQMQEAAELGVTFHVCTMSMGIMGIQKQDLMTLPNLHFGGVTAFTESARRSSISMTF